MAARPARTDAQNPTPPPPPLWPLLCSAVLVGMMIASEVHRAYHTSGITADRPETGAFGTGRSSDKPAAAQHKRARQFGRGRQAQAPWQIPWQGWKDILWRTYYQIGEDRLLAVAAGVVFYGLLAVFPAVTALVSLYGLFASPSAISDQQNDFTPDECGAMQCALGFACSTAENVMEAYRGRSRRRKKNQVSRGYSSFGYAKRLGKMAA